MGCYGERVAWRLLPSTGVTTKMFRIYDNDNTIDRLVINGSGNVGIGTNAPDCNLTLETTGAGTGTDTSSQLRIQDDEGSNKQFLKLGVNSSSNYGYIQTTEENVAHNKLAINPLGGNVGIGNAAPSKTLDVTGDINFTGTLYQAGVEFSSGGDAPLYTSNTLSASSSTAPSGLFFAVLSSNSNNIEVSQTSGEKTTRNDTSNPLPLRWNVATSNASSVSQWGRNNVGKGTIDLNTYDLIGRNVTTRSLNDGTCVHVKVTGIYEISFAIPVYSNQYRVNPCISVGIVTNPHSQTNGTYNDTRMFASNGYIRADSGNNICMMILSPIILQINANQGIQVYGRYIASWGRNQRAQVRTTSTGLGYLFVKRIA